MATTDTPPIRERSFEEGRELLDRQAHLRLGMSGEEFLRAWVAVVAVACVSPCSTSAVATTSPMRRTR